MFNLKHYILTKEIVFSDIVNDFLNYKYLQVKKSTFLKYKYLIEKYLYPELKNLTIKELLNYDFNILINNYQNLDTTTIKLLTSILKSILKFAERKYDVDFKIDLIKCSSKIQEELQVFSNNEKQKLIAYCYNNYTLKTLGILMSLYTGIRIGELCALKWKNIDLENDIINITETLQRVYVNNSTQILIDSPKSNSSIRKIPINKKLHDILISIKSKNSYESENYFLTGLNDKFIEPRNYQYTFKIILEKLNLPHYNFHILRHTFATDCINLNMDVKSLSKILGHSNVSITLNKYVHPSLEKIKIYLERI